MLKHILYLIPLLFLSFFVKAAIPVQPSVGGAWYKASEDGLGFVVNISQDESGQLTFLATWYVYDNQGNQMWLIGSTPFNEGDMNVTVPVIVTKGAIFDTFNSNDVVRTDWGTLTFEFTDCNHGTVTHEPILDFPSGTTSIERLTNTAGARCTASIPNTPGTSGADPEPGTSNPDTPNPTPIADTPPGEIDKRIAIISSSVQPGFVKPVCEVQATVRNNSSQQFNLTVFVDLFSGNVKVGQAAPFGEVSPGETTTLSNFAPIPGLDCSQLEARVNGTSSL